MQDMEIELNENFIIGLETLPRDSVDVLLSFLTMDDYIRLSLVSSTLRSLVTQASHLLMEETMVNSLLSPPDHSARVSFRLCLDQVGLNRLLGRFRCLNVVRLENLSEVGDELLKIINSSPAALHLKSLSVCGANLTYWCGDSLELPNLRRLEIAGGSVRASLSSLLGPSTSQLETLIIDRCNYIRDDQLMDVTGRLHNSLRKVQFQQCLRLRSPVLRLAQLETLRMIGCFDLTALPHLHCPLLTTLDLSFCFRVKSDAIHAAIDASPVLKRLHLVKCPSMETLSIKSTTLEYLNIQLSHNLKTCVLKCPNLAQFELSGCSSLKFLMVESRVLQLLDVSSLPVIRLELYVPNLRYLDVSSCRQLDQTVIRCHHLDVVHYKGSRLVALRFCKQVRAAIMNRWMSPLASSTYPRISSTSRTLRGPS